jgi:signal transduction histidine kinase
MLDRIKWHVNPSPRAIALSTTGMIFLIGFIDWISGWEISWSVIYVFPIAIAAWYIGPGFAYALSALSVILWITGDFATGLQVSSLLIPVWNSAIRLIFYYVIIRMLVYIRSLTAVLEDRVLQRTADLRKEITGRERLERELLEVGERERRRLGYDLHDGLCQHLTGTALAVQVLREKLVRRGLPEAREAADAIALIEEGIDLSHRLAKGLQPVDMQVGGLMQALQDFASATASLFKVSCRFECDSPILIADVGMADHLYRIAQEATSNAIQHGRATNVVITLDVNDEGTFLRVEDNGIGIPQPLPENGGMGLRIMAQRANLIGGRIDIRSAPALGTTITCYLPESVKDRESRRVPAEA